MIRACPPLYPSLLYTKICVDRKEKLPAFELWLLFFFFFCSEKNFGYLKNSKWEKAMVLTSIIMSDRTNTRENCKLVILMD